MFRSVPLLPLTLAALTGCGSTISGARPPSSAQLSSASVLPTPCTAELVELSAEQVSPGGTYEVVGVVDLSRPIANDPIALDQRIRHRACAMNADAVGVMTTASGTSAEYVAVRKRPAPKKAPPLSVTVQYFPSMNVGGPVSNDTTSTPESSERPVE